MYPLKLHPRTNRPHAQAEAFCLMLYRDTAGNEEWIWNSRDGVTPFGILSRQGLDASHVEWERDRYAPNHVPNVGDRIFADMTPERAREIAGRRFDAYPEEAKSEAGFLELYPTRWAFVELVAFGMLEQFWPHTPTVLEVTAEMRQEFIRPCSLESDLLTLLKDCAAEAENVKTRTGE